ncbi:MAG: SDR family oxidoreductase [Bauldia sp.]|uniref:SDR family oxidoreductase n=1 Tax=Bauldia sp. TaxID=2575872 RepID=UPI001D6B2122|nr:SDR family oxidoreductase [Bauldia sp.]MCB1496444.1 SDR family oxidoreductase [Bauldia sp.]
MRLFVLGLGYSATAFVAAVRDRAETIGGTVRGPEKAAALRADGITTLAFDGTRPGDGVAEALGEATHLLVSIAPGEEGDRVLRHHRGDIRAARKLAWVGYLSTVGVYGDHGGAWIDEETTPRPRRGRSEARLEAEQEWAGLAGEQGVPLGIFRIAGIYGPGRNALANLAEGKARRLVKPGQVFNRIHVADIATTLAAAAARPATRIYNLADDEPAPPQDVVAYAAGLMGVAAPSAIPFDEAELSPMARSFYGENKRVSNRRIKDELGVTLRHPTYREGLGALWREGNWKGEG